jgi:hypothetical protein
MTPRTIVLSALLAIAPAAAGAQRGAKTPAKSAACRVDSSGIWFRKQREWLDESKHEWSNDTLRANLLQAAAIDAGKPLTVQLGVYVEGRDAPPSLGATADTTISQLRRLGRGSTAPTKSVVGPAGTRAVWLLAQRDTGLARSTMRRMMEAGPSESFGPDVATLEDRVRLLSGRKQLFGTQFRVDERGTVVLAPMEDSAHADLRREEAMLPPLRVGLCLARTR